MQTELSDLELINKIRADYTDRYTFKKSSVFFWSSADNTIHYSGAKSLGRLGPWTLLHELGHAELQHTSYRDDLELLMMEVAAWQEAKRLAQSYGVSIDEEHIDACLESYRQWLHTRSQCPNCRMHAFQSEFTTYECHNCLTKWQVPASRMCAVRKRRVS